MLTLLVQFHLLLFRRKQWIQWYCRRKRQGMLSFLKSSASQEKDGRKRITMLMLRNIKNLQISLAHYLGVCLWYQSCDPKEALPSSSRASS